MTMDSGYQNYSSAVEDFHEARRQAALHELFARLRGESTELLSFDEVRKRLKGETMAETGLQDIPLDAIVGSVGRYTDFTRDFLPKKGTLEERWARVKLAASDMAGLPPIEVYKIGEAYFVKDGNHRVSVARQMGAKGIQAYVTEVKTRVPLTPDMKPDDIIMAAEYADFLERSHLDELRPEAELTVTVPGKYHELLEHIAVHQYYMGLDFQRDVSWEEAVAHWHDHVYLPVMKVIRELGLLHNFPERTETDLYLFIAEHRAALAADLGWEVPTEAAASDLVNARSEKPEKLAARLGSRLLEAMALDTWEPGPPPGQWRQERLIHRRDDCLFSELLVPVNGLESGWSALEQALVVARHEGAYVHGLHIVPDAEQRESEAAQRVRAEFNARCAQIGVAGNLVFAVGGVPNRIVDRARWNDLVVLSLLYPPEPQPIARMGSGFREIIQRSPRPILVTRQKTSEMRRAILAYDDSPKAREALYIAAYLAARWGTEINVLHAANNGGEQNSTVLDKARAYLEKHSVQAVYFQENGQPARLIVQLCEAQNCELILIGGYSQPPMLEVVLGSVVDQVLRESRIPVLICK